MRGILCQNLEKGDLIAIVSISGNWSSSWVGVLDGTFTPGGKPRYILQGGRRDYAYKSRMIKISPEQLVALVPNVEAREQLIEISEDLKE